MWPDGSGHKYGVKALAVRESISSLAKLSWVACFLSAKLPGVSGLEYPLCNRPSWVFWEAAHAHPGRGWAGSMLALCLGWACHQICHCNFFFFLEILFIYSWLCWVLLAARGFSLVAVSRALHCGARASLCSGFSGCRARVLWVAVAHGLRCFSAYGIFSDQGWNPCLLGWQTDS